MTTTSETGRPWCWHVVLGPAVPILGLLWNNLDSTDPSAAIAPIAVAVGISLTVWGLLYALTREPRGAALATTVLMLGALSYPTLSLAGEALGSIWGPTVVYAMVLAVAGVMFRLAAGGSLLTRFANRALAIAVALFSVQIGYAEWRRPRQPSAPAIAVAPVTATDAPDVYILILDGFGREDVLQSHYGIEADGGLAGSLRRSGFLVARDARANYSQTAHSLSSALNTDYLPTLLGGTDSERLSRRNLADLIESSSFIRAFAAAGYRVDFHRSEYSLLRPPPGSERRGRFWTPNEFHLALYETTPLPALSQLVGLARGWLPLTLHRAHVRQTLADLERPTESEGPSLSFAHVLAPHPPFAFHADGSDRDTPMPALLADGSQWRDIAKGTGRSYQAGYAEAVRFLGVRVTEVVRNILAHATRPTIVYIQGDHGPGSRLDFNDAGESDLVERFGILLALRLPGGEGGLPDSVTPVNAFRIIMNKALGLTLPMLDDRSYFSTLERPFAFEDVTERLSHVRLSATDDGLVH